MIFDDADENEYQLRITSNKNIKAVLNVVIENSELTFEERLKYAREVGELPYKKSDDGEVIQRDGSPVVEFTNTYINQSHYWAALAQALFLGCPDLVQINDAGDPEIVNQDMNDKLIRSQVHQGLDDFLQSFGLKAPTRGDFFELFQIDQNAPNQILDMVSKALTQRGEKPVK